MVSFRSKMAKIVHKLKNWATTVRQWWSGITRRGLRGPASRYAGHAALLVVVVLGTWAARVGVRSLPASETIPLVENDAGEAVSTSQSDLSIEDLPAFEFAGGGMQGVSRTVDIHTNIPSRPRMEIVKYLVQSGDTLFGIADKYGLKPETILWGNWEELVGDPHSLVPGLELSILPVDGSLHLWSAGESLSGVARFFGVTAEDIIEWPGNELDPTVDANDPPITAGTALIVPGGRREIPTWRAPRITRSNPASAQILGPGHCGSIYDGPVGDGVFIWPTTAHYLSGFHYTEIHPAIDIGGSVGGWQSLYAHLDLVNVACGQAVFSGNVVGTMGLTGRTTGPHLHFELMSDAYGKVNPMLFLQ